MAVATLAIVERINVVGDVSDRQVTVFVDLLPDPFLLQTTEEGLSDRIEAPMCQECGKSAGSGCSTARHASSMVLNERVIDLACDEALETANDVLLA